MFGRTLEDSVEKNALYYVQKDTFFSFFAVMKMEDAQ